MAEFLSFQVRKPSSVTFNHLSEVTKLEAG